LALARAGAILRGAMTRAEVHEQLVVQADALVASDKTAVFVSRRRGDLVAAATRGFSRAVARRLRYRAGEAQIGRAVLTRRQIVCHDTEADPRGMGSFAEAEGIRSFVHVPIEVGEGVYGVLNVNSLRPDAFGPRDQRVLAELARHASVALQNALLFERERENAEALQDALLAEEPPEVPGLELATLYRAAAGAMVGGDLYNIWRLSDGRVAVLVGDVSGKGVAAAGATAMIRFLAEGLSAREDDPGRLLDDLGRLGGPRLSEGSFVTVFLAVLDPRTGLMQWADAGPPPRGAGARARRRRGAAPAARQRPRERISHPLRRAAARRRPDPLHRRHPRGARDGRRAVRRGAPPRRRPRPCRRSPRRDRAGH